MGKGPKPSSEDVRGAALPAPSGPTLAFVNKWCGLCCNGVSVFALRGEDAAEEADPRGFYEVGLEKSKNGLG